MPWRALLRPVRAGTVTAAKPAVRRAVPPPPSTPSAYVSPLQEEVRTIVALKRGCTYHCTGCAYGTGNKCALDTRLAKAATERDDPTPYLKDLHLKLDKLTQSNAVLTEKLEQSKKWQQPITRLRLGIYTAMGTGMVTAAITIAKVLIGLP